MLRQDRVRAELQASGGGDREPEQEAAVADTTQEQDQAEARDPAAPYGSEGGAKVALALCRRLRIGAVHVVAHDDAALAAMRLALLSDQQDQQQQQHDSQVSGAQQGPGVRVLSLCLLHPNTHGEVASKLMEHLLTSGIKAAARRHLVRMEVEVALRRQCYRSGTIPADRMHFYKRPLYLRHWERALRLGIQANQRDQDAGEGLAREIVVSGGEAAGGRRRVRVVRGREDAMVAPPPGRAGIHGGDPPGVQPPDPPLWRVRFWPAHCDEERRCSRCNYKFISDHGGYDQPHHNAHHCVVVYAGGGPPTSPGPTRPRRLRAV